MKLLITTNEGKVVETIHDLDSLNLIEPMAQISLCMMITDTINAQRLICAEFFQIPVPGIHLTGDFTVLMEAEVPPENPQ